jgi:hypothetical protein
MTNFPVIKAKIRAKLLRIQGQNLAYLNEASAKLLSISAGRKAGIPGLAAIRSVHCGAVGEKRGSRKKLLSPQEQ